MHMKKFFFCFLFFFLTIFPIKALELNSEYVVLYNLNDDQVVYELKKDEVTSIASLTKIMTTLVAIDLISDYNQQIVINKNMFVGLEEANAAVIGLKDKQKVTYNDLLYGMFLASGADATRAIAISLAGSENNFVMLMNQKVREMGLSHTHFVNTVGLDDKNHYSTVNDVALLLKKAFENEKFKEIFMTESYTLSDHSMTVSSTFKKTAKNYQLPYDFILGAKTGYTENAGRCLASIAYDQKNDITYLLVTTGAPSSPKHIMDAVNIYHYYFNHYKYYPLVEKEDIILTLKTKYSKQKEVTFSAPKEITKYLNQPVEKEDILFEYHGKSIITPNMKSGTGLGYINVIYDHEIVETFEITLSSSVPFSLFAFIIANRFFLIIGILLILCICFITQKMIQIHKEKLHH